VSPGSSFTRATIQGDGEAIALLDQGQELAI